MAAPLPHCSHQPALCPARSAPLEARAALIAANELLHYRPVDDVYEEWLDRIAELVQRSKNGAAKKSLARKGLPGRSLLQLRHAKTPLYS